MWYVAINIGTTTGGYAFKLGYGNYGGGELAAEMQAKLRTVDATAQVSYVSKMGRLQVVKSAGRQIKVIADEELTNPNFLATWALPPQCTISAIRSASTRSSEQNPRPSRRVISAN